MSVPPLVAVERASKTFRVGGFFAGKAAVEALRDVSFSIDRGRALALVGESGSGKSTCARAIAGLIELTSGRILIRGQEMWRARGRTARLERAHAVQMIFQDPFSALNPAHTVRHHLARPLKLRGHLERDCDASIRRLLREVELEPDEVIGKYPHELSGGERQRVTLARALAVGAEVIIADEPTSMLDASIRRSVLDLMRRLKEERGVAFLYVTHDIATGSHFAEDIAVMFAGRIVERGPSAEVTANPLHPYTQLLLAARPQPGGRMTEMREAGRGFTALATATRARTREGTGDLVEASPGHFVREARQAA